MFRLRVIRRSFSLWSPSCGSTDGWLGSSEPEPVTMFPLGFNALFFLTRGHHHGSKKDLLLSLGAIIEERWVCVYSCI